MKILTDTGFMLMKGVDALKKGYRNYKTSKKEQYMKEKRANAEKNIKSVMNANPEMGKRMQSSYEEMKKKGVY